MDTQEVTEKDFKYAPPSRRGQSYDRPATPDLGEYLNENLARLESLKIKVLEFPMLSQKDKDHFFHDLDLLRSGFINLASQKYRGPELARPGTAAKKSFSWKEDLIIEGIIGNSSAIAHILKIIAHVAPSNLTVLLEGETGTGKELFARILHQNSRRQKFVAVNCGAFPPGVIESELFGHVQGAFTGATSDRKGKFEEAHGGTIFLDEIGELEPFAQVKLLRVLEVGEIQRVGSDKHRQVDVRVIAATNRNLAEMVRLGKFREDLYYRLNMCPIHLPPLRERRDEIEILLQYFLEEACAKQNKPVPALDPELRLFFSSVYQFSGNIRELKNLAQFMACIGDGERPVTRADLPDRYRGGEAPEASGETGNGNGQDHRLNVIRDAEKSYWLDLLKKHRGNVRRICEETQLSRSRVYQILERHVLKANLYR